MNPEELKRYRIDLLQPGHPEFNKYWGKDVLRRQLLKEQNEKKSREMWGESKERKEWEERQKAGQGTDWKSKRL